jgi:Resolvase, N terminal domain
VRAPTLGSPDRAVGFGHGDRHETQHLSSPQRPTSSEECFVRVALVDGAGVDRRWSDDPSTAAGKAFLDMLGCFAEFETNLRRERQMEGIAKAKAAGVYKGRKPSIDQARVRGLRQDGLGRRPSPASSALDAQASIGSSGERPRLEPSMSPD